MAASVQCCLAITSKLRALSINSSPSSSSSSTRLSSFSFSANLSRSHSFFSKGSLSMTAALRPKRQSLAVVCEAAPTRRRVNSAAKRTRQAEERSVYNKARKSEVKTRINKGRDGVFLRSCRRIHRKFLEVTTSEVLSKADFKNTRFLAKFITERGKIIGRSQTGVSIKAQRKIVREIKVARCFGLLPFTAHETKTKSFAM